MQKCYAMFRIAEICVGVHCARHGLRPQAHTTHAHSLDTLVHKYQLNRNTITLFTGAKWSIRLCLFISSTIAIAFASVAAYRTHTLGINRLRRLYKCQSIQFCAAHNTHG